MMPLEIIVIYLSRTLALLLLLLLMLLAAVMCERAASAVITADNSDSRNSVLSFHSRNYQLTNKST